MRASDDGRPSDATKAAATCSASAVFQRLGPSRAVAAYLAASIFFAASAPAWATSAFTPSPIGFTSTVTLRIFPVNLLS